VEFCGVQFALLMILMLSAGPYWLSALVYGFAQAVRQPVRVNTAIRHYPLGINPPLADRHLISFAEICRRSTRAPPVEKANWPE